MFLYVLIVDIKEILKLFNSTHIFIFQRFMIPYWKHLDLGRHQRRVPGVNQSVNIQLPSAEDREGFLWNIGIKNMSVIEQF